MISDEFALEVLRALSAADRFGMSLTDLAVAVWPEKPRDPRQHSVLGAALGELKERRLVVSSGGKKARWALTPAGERWLDGYHVVPGDDEPAPVRGPAYRESMPLDPLQVAVDEACQRPRLPLLPAGTPAWSAYARGQVEGRASAEQSIAQIRQVSRSPAEFQAAVAEMERRTAQQIWELEREMRARGLDPHAYS